MVCCCNLFTEAIVELGLSHYTEHRPPWLQWWFTDWIPMPLNTLVNLAYIVVGYRYTLIMLSFAFCLQNSALHQGCRQVFLDTRQTGE
jgi:hypothetical protein